MCRSIKTLRRADEPATDDEIHAAALQFVRKVSGYRAPSRANQAAFDKAVAEIAHASQRLLDGLAPVGTRVSVTADDAGVGAAGVLSRGGAAASPHASSLRGPVGGSQGGSPARSNGRSGGR